MQETAKTFWNASPALRAAVLVAAGGFGFYALSCLAGGPKPPAEPPSPPAGGIVQQEIQAAVGNPASGGLLPKAAKTTDDALTTVDDGVKVVQKGVGLAGQVADYAGGKLTSLLSSETKPAPSDKPKSKEP